MHIWRKLEIWRIAKLVGAGETGYNILTGTPNALEKKLLGARFE